MFSDDDKTFMQLMTENFRDYSQEECLAFAEALVAMVRDEIPFHPKSDYDSD